MRDGKNKPPVFFHFTYPLVSFKNRTVCKAFIEYLFKKEKTALRKLDYIFCSDDSLLQINKQFLSHDFYTDIISFPLSELTEPVVGEIYISIDRVKENSVTYQASFSEELHRVIFHGALHLCGYKDKTQKEAALMRFQEKKYLALYKNRLFSRGTLLK